MPSGKWIFDFLLVAAWMLGVPAPDPRHAAAVFNTQSQELRAQLETKRGSGNFSGFCSAIVRLLMLGTVDKAQAAWVGCQLAHATMSFAISNGRIESWSASMRLLNANRGVRFVGDMCRAVIAKLPEREQEVARNELESVVRQQAGTASSVMRLLRQWCASVFSLQHEGRYYLDLILGRMEWILAQQDVNCLRRALLSRRGFACSMKPAPSRGRKRLLEAVHRQPAVSHTQPAASSTQPASQEPPPKRARTDEYPYAGAGCGAGAGSDEATWFRAAALRQPAAFHPRPASNPQPAVSNPQPAVSNPQPAVSHQPASSHTHPASHEPPPRRARTDEYAYGGVGCEAGAGSDDAPTPPLLDDVSSDHTGRDSTYHGEQNEGAAFLDALLSDDYSFSDLDNDVSLESNMFGWQAGTPPPEGSPDPTTDHSPGPSHGSDRS